MRKTFSLGVAAMTAAVGMLTAGEGVARDRHYDGRYYDGRYYNHRYRDRDNDDAIAAGIVGLALGAALASGSSNSRSYYGSGYRSRYYDGPRYRYYDGPRYGYYDRPRCRTVRAYDPYYGRVYERRCW